MSGATKQMIVSTNGLTKSYGGRTVLDSVDIRVPEGAIYGFIGANGAGKTTTLKILMGLISATSGEATVMGMERGSLPVKPLDGIAYLPDVPEINSWLTAREALLLFGSISGVDRNTAPDRAESLLKHVGLENTQLKVGGFSRGMKQRLGIAVALMGSPRLLILDEPTSALDPIGRAQVLEIIESLRGKTTVLFSSHLLADVQQVCSHVGILNRGQLLSQGTLKEVIASAPQPETSIRLSGQQASIVRARNLLERELPEITIQSQANSLQNAYTHLVKGRNS